jgi:hypothetical protein
MTKTNSTKSPVRRKSAAAPPVNVDWVYQHPDYHPTLRLWRFLWPKMSDAEWAAVQAIEAQKAAEQAEADERRYNPGQRQPVASLEELMEWDDFDLGRPLRNDGYGWPRMTPKVMKQLVQAREAHAQQLREEEQRRLAAIQARTQRRQERLREAQALREYERREMEEQARKYATGELQTIHLIVDENGDLMPAPPAQKPQAKKQRGMKKHAINAGSYHHVR